MKVWIDQDLCTGDGLCEEIAPHVFTLLDDGLAYVKEGDKVFATAKGNPEGAEGLAEIPTASSTRSSSPPRSAPASATTSSPRRFPTPSASQEPGGGQKAGVRDHPVVGAHRLAVDVPPRWKHSNVRASIQRPLSASRACVAWVIAGV